MRGEQILVMNIDPNGTWSWKKFWRGFGITAGIVAAAVGALVGLGLVCLLIGF